MTRARRLHNSSELGQGPVTTAASRRMCDQLCRTRADYRSTAHRNGQSGISQPHRGGRMDADTPPFSMPGSDRRSQPAQRWVARASFVAALAAAALALAGSAPAEARLKMADAFLVNEKGTWFCPDDQGVTCPESRGSQAFAQILLKRPSALAGVYLRVAKAPSDCALSDDVCKAGVPDRTLCPTNADTPFCVVHALKANRVKLGIVIGAAKDGSEAGEPRSPAALAGHACKINQADSEHLYDFVFLDLAYKLGYGQLKQAVRLIQGGRIIRTVT